MLPVPGDRDPPGGDPLDDERGHFIRSLDELDIDDLVRIDEEIGGRYRPEVWETRVGYYLRRDPDPPIVAEADGRVVGLHARRAALGEFGLEEPTGWVEVLGVDPAFRGRAVGRRMAEAILEHFREEGAASVRTLVDERMEDLASFFSALGFAPSTLRPFVKTL